jgi:hypothetical protein
MTGPKLPAPWLRTRDAAERERERAHLAAMQAHERRMQAIGYVIRLKAPKAASAGDTPVAFSGGKP